MTGGPAQAETFGALHANWYDRWHREKDYGSEVDQLGEIFTKHGPVDSVVDLGCGTGRHLELLADAGHEVVGIDRSAVMVRRARDRLARFGPRADVVEADLSDVALGRTFDAAIMMFSVLGYQLTNRSLRAALDTVHRLLRPGGLFLFDILDGTAILAKTPRGGFTVVADGDQQLLRATAAFVTVEEQVYQMDVRLWLLAGDRLLDQVEESHRIRYFLPRELDLLLDVTGFDLLDSARVADGQPGPAREWSRLVWARRR